MSFSVPIMVHPPVYDRSVWIQIRSLMLKWNYCFYPYIFQLNVSNGSHQSLIQSQSVGTDETIWNSITKETLENDRKTMKQEWKCYLHQRWTHQIWTFMGRICQQGLFSYSNGSFYEWRTMKLFIWNMFFINSAVLCVHHRWSYTFV